MKKALILSTLLVSTQTFAISDSKLAEKCFNKGKEKIEAQAKLFNCSYDDESVEVNDVDNRWYNPSKYVWYQLMGECNGYDRIIKLVQYSRGTCY